jgi:hypothetical protein
LVYLDLKPTAFSLVYFQRVHSVCGEKAVVSAVAAPPNLKCTEFYVFHWGSLGSEFCADIRLLNPREHMWFPPEWSLFINVIGHQSLVSFPSMDTKMEEYGHYVAYSDEWFSYCLEHFHLNVEQSHCLQLLIA